MRYSVKKLHETTKLHYGKFLYKIKIHSELSSVIRQVSKKKKSTLSFYQKLDDVDNQLNGKSKITVKQRYRQYDITKKDAADARKIGEFILNNDVNVRIEMCTIYIYSNDLAQLEALSKSLSIADTVELWKPDEKMAELMLKDADTVVVKNSDGFKYRVILTCNKSNSGSLGAWIKKNKDKVKASEYALWVLENDHWFTNLTINVKDEKVMTLLQMLNQSNIKKIYNIVEKP
jgi:hypothetical protein